MGEIVTPRWRVSPAGGICSTSSRRKIFPFSRHSAISLDIPEDAPSASLYRRKASPRIPRTCSAAGFELEIIPVAFTTSSPAGIFLVTSSLQRSEHDLGFQLRSIPCEFLRSQLSVILCLLFPFSTSDVQLLTFFNQRCR